jgi:hypothetical protein
MRLLSVVIMLLFTIMIIGHDCWSYYDFGYRMQVRAFFGPNTFEGLPYPWSVVCTLIAQGLLVGALWWWVLGKNDDPTEDETDL